MIRFIQSVIADVPYWYWTNVVKFGQGGPSITVYNKINCCTIMSLRLCWPDINMRQNSARLQRIRNIPALWRTVSFRWRFQSWRLNSALLKISGYWSKPWHLVNPKIAGLKWMFIPLKMVLIGIDPYPYLKIRAPIPPVKKSRDPPGAPNSAGRSDMTAVATLDFLGVKMVIGSLDHQRWWRF